ncbi:MAG TPA: hypothetical protein VF461_12665 [Gemmatimonadaceae bacterium]
MLLSTLQGRVVQSARAVLTVAVLMMATAHQSANAQQATRLRLAVDATPRAAQPPRPTSLHSLPVAADSGERRNPVVHGAQVGALVGVAAGLAYTLVLNTTKSCSEKTNIACAEDQHDYRTFTVPIIGGVLGGVVGALVGAYRR